MGGNATANESLCAQESVALVMAADMLAVYSSIGGPSD